MIELFRIFGPYISNADKLSYVVKSANEDTETILDFNGIRQVSVFLLDSILDACSNPILINLDDRIKDVVLNVVKYRAIHGQYLY